MSRADLSAPRRTRLGVAALVIALHVAAVLVLIRAFAPQFTVAVAERVTSVFTVEVRPPDPKPSPQSKASEPAGAAAEAGRRAVAKDVVAPKPKLAVASPTPLPPIAGKGEDAASGARDVGAGTGPGGQGTGTGSGSGGSGQGGGAVSKLEKIAGNIDSTRDYPAAGRDARRGDSVTIRIAVDAEGKPQDCGIVRPSRDPEADRITCRLALKRFRFRPRTDAAGNPSAGVYQWTQRWWAPGEKD